jgi:WhiB family redox-sensing transcriptional regulator
VSAWTDAAACRTEDPNLFHPDGSTGPWLRVIEEAKAVCRSCPVSDTCLQDALDSSEGGIRGGLTEAERASLQRAIVRRRLTAEAVAARVAQARNGQPAPRPRTVREYADRYGVPVFGGHLGWDGPKWPQIDGNRCTPAQIVFAADRGRHPEGRVVANCGYSGCIKPSHVTDDMERRQAAARYARAA